MKKPKDAVKDVEGKGQIIWCLIMKGRADRKRPVLMTYVQLAKRYCIPLNSIMI